MLHKYSASARRTVATHEAQVPGWDYVASAAGRLSLNSTTRPLGPGPVQAGDALLVKVLQVNPGYEDLELPNGERARLRPGDRLVGVAGTRKALRGFVGHPPDRVKPGDNLALLSLGGIVGVFQGGHLDLGVATSVKVIDRLGRNGAPVSLAEDAIPPRDDPGPLCPVIAVVGTSMSAGKTRAAGEVVAGAVKDGFRVAAVKLTGVASLKDLIGMKARGAKEVLSFLDAGWASTVDHPAISPMAYGLMHRLNASSPDLMVVELGDGILGPYGVDHLLQDPKLNTAIRALVLTASDHVGAWGGVELLKGWGLTTDVVTGPVTDSAAASGLVEQVLGVPAVNACTEGHRLFETIRPKLSA